MPTVTQRPVLDTDTGNINIQAAEGLDKPFQRGTKQVDGSYVYTNISAHTYTLHIEGPNGDIALPCVNGNTVYEKRIRAEPADLEDLVIGTYYPYSLLDTSGPVPISRLEGKIKLRGFRT